MPILEIERVKKWLEGFGGKDQGIIVVEKRTGQGLRTNCF